MLLNIPKDTLAGAVILCTISLSSFLSFPNAQSTQQSNQTKPHCQISWIQFPYTSWHQIHCWLPFCLTGLQYGLCQILNNLYKTSFFGIVKNLLDNPLQLFWNKINGKFHLWSKTQYTTLSFFSKFSIRYNVYFFHMLSLHQNFYSCYIHTLDAK